MASSAREKFAWFFATKDGLTYKASTKDVLWTLFGLAQVRWLYLQSFNERDVVDIVWTSSDTRRPFEYPSCLLHLWIKSFFPIRKFHAKHFRIYEANFAITEVHVDFSIMDSE